MAKGLIATGWSPGAVVTARVVGAAIVMLVPTSAALRGQWPELRRQWRLVAAYGFMGVALCQLAYFNAVTHLSVGVALLLEYLAPVVIVGWLWLRHRRPPRGLTVLGAVLALSGLAFALDLGGPQQVDALGVVWGLLAATGVSGYFLLAGDAKTSLSPIALAGSGLVVGSAILVGAGALGIVPMDARTADVELLATTMPWWVPIAELAVVSAALAYATGVVAVRALGSKVASFVGLTEVLFAILFAWWLVGELPRPVQLVGGLLIVGGVVAVRTDEQRDESRTAHAAGEPGAGPDLVPAATDAEFCLPGEVD